MKNVAENILVQSRREVERVLGECRPWSRELLLAEAMEYAVFPGGKRLRPILTLLVGNCYGTERRGLNAVASAIELVHCASLVLDDHPSMDAAPLRQGRESLHRKYGGDIAILTAHSLVALAFEIISGAEMPPANRCQILKELSLAIGAHGMAAGQAIDLQGGKDKSEREVRKSSNLKTGLLFKAAATCGALASGAAESDIETCSNLGLHLGLAYQMADDLLDFKEEDNPDKSVNAVHALGKENTLAIVIEELKSARKAMAAISDNGKLEEYLNRVEDLLHG